jgi:hypothetical protein
MNDDTSEKSDLTAPIAGVHTPYHPYAKQAHVSDPQSGGMAWIGFIPRGPPL